MVVVESADAFGLLRFPFASGVRVLVDFELRFGILSPVGLERPGAGVPDHRRKSEP